MFTLFGLGLYVCKENAQSDWLNAMTYTVIGMGTCLLIIIAMKGGKWGLRSLLSNKLTARLGVLSYGVYLIHLHVNYIVFPFFKRFPLIQNESAFALINFLLPFIPAYFMYFYLDEYFARFKHRKIKLPVTSIAKGAEVKSEAGL
jgi:peptidoglycan/LPS O-acetylase OafA/YrhL